MYDIVGESVCASVLASFDLSDKTGLSAILFINFFDSVKFIVNKFDLFFFSLFSSFFRILSPLSIIFFEQIRPPFLFFSFFIFQISSFLP